jgi:hypothetical protein
MDMPDHEGRGQAVYDHDNEEPRSGGRRRRQVADWGVGEEMFDHLPGRRFERRGHRDIPRGDANDGRRTIVIETGDEELPRERPAPSAEEEFASRDEALRARVQDDELWAGDEAFADAPAAADEADEGDEAAEDRWTGDGWADESAPADDRWAAAEAWAARGDAVGADEIARPRDDGNVRGGVDGRRTVKIGGRPMEFHGTAGTGRRRPPRTVHERLGSRPERIVAWAFALGILLILIAIATQNA